MQLERKIACELQDCEAALRHIRKQHVLTDQQVSSLCQISPALFKSH